MAKKSMKEAAAAGTSVFDQIAAGTAQGVKEKIPMERLNLRIPADIKEYLTVAAAKASIEQRRSISLTEYLCELVRADMDKHKEG